MTVDDILGMTVTGLLIITATKDVKTDINPLHVLAHGNDIRTAIETSTHIEEETDLWREEEMAEIDTMTLKMEMTALTTLQEGRSRKNIADHP